MSRDDLAWIAVAILLLAVGYLIGQRSTIPPESAEGLEMQSLRPRLWEDRNLDLAVQVGLVFVGALGIVALLPQGREEGAE
jgi:hypothetical protein